eukprot:362772-Chlamydomonas_euryale.AAC.11
MRRVAKSAPLAKWNESTLKVKETEDALAVTKDEKEIEVRRTRQRRRESYAVMCHAEPCHGTMPCHVVPTPCCAMPCTVVPCHTVPCRPVLGQARPRRTRSSRAMACRTITYSAVLPSAMSCPTKLRPST